MNSLRLRRCDSREDTGPNAISSIRNEASFSAIVLNIACIPISEKK